MGSCTSPATKPPLDPVPAKTTTQISDSKLPPTAEAEVELLNHDHGPTPRRGAQTKHPSQYIQCIHASEGTATGDNASLPHGVQGTSIAEVAEDDCTTYDYALSAAIPTSTEPRNEWEAHSSPDWPHWHKAMQAEVSELI